MTARAPAHLRPATRKWWRKTAEDFALEEHHLRLLTLAGEAWDRATEAREAIAAAGGPYILDRFKQPRAHPAVAVERDSRLAFARLVRELCLDDFEPPAPRPERLAGGR